jgi:hypothetical protein
MGLMGWAVLLCCYAAKQLEASGEVTNTMMISGGCGCGCVLGEGEGGARIAGAQYVMVM